MLKKQLYLLVEHHVCMYVQLFGDLRSSLEAFANILPSHRDLEPFFNSDMCPKCASRISLEPFV